MQERAREQEKVQQNQPAHPSQAVVQTAVHSKTANRHLNAMEMIEWASTRHKREQMRQQQLEQQALAEQQRVQAQQAALAAGAMQQPPAAQLPAVSLLEPPCCPFVCTVAPPNLLHGHWGLVYTLQTACAVCNARCMCNAEETGEVRRQKAFYVSCPGDQQGPTDRIQHIKKQ